MGKRQNIIQQILGKISVPRFLSYLTWGTIASSVNCYPVLAEGSQQLGIDPVRGVSDNGLNVYLFEYDADTIFFQDPNEPRPIYVNIESAGEIINVSLCGWRRNDDLGIEVFKVNQSVRDADGNPVIPSFRTELNYSTDVARSSPGELDNDRWELASGNASTVNNTLCNNESNPDSVPTNGNFDSTRLSNPVRFIAPEAGVYEIRLYNLDRTGDNAVFTYFDITVTSPDNTPDTLSASERPNPNERQGRIWAYAWQGQLI